MNALSIPGSHLLALGISGCADVNECEAGTSDDPSARFKYGPFNSSLFLKEPFVYCTLVLIYIFFHECQILRTLGSDSF